MSKKCKILITLSIIFLVIVLLGSNYIVNADMGAKPSITIKLKNMKTKNYLIDLLVYDDTGEKYSSPLDYNGNDGEESEQYRAPSYKDSGYNDLRTITIRQLETLHKINYDGWISESTRWSAYFLFGNCNGNSKHEHYFNYFGTPETYKVVIIYNNTGETKVTDVIHRTDFSSNITIDVDTMNVVKSAQNIKTIDISLILTVAVEIIVALIMKIKNIKTIFIVNLITNIILQLALIYIPLSYMLTFTIMEILVIITEYLIYKKYFNNIPKNKVITYTLIANIISALLTFIIQ